MAKHVKYQPNKANGLSLSDQYYEIRRKSKYRRYRRFLCFTKHNTKVYISTDCPTDKPYCELDQSPNPLPSHMPINEPVKQQPGSHKIYIMFSS